MARRERELKKREAVVDRRERELAHDRAALTAAAERELDKRKVHPTGGSASSRNAGRP